MSKRKKRETKSPPPAVQKTVPRATYSLWSAEPAALRVLWAELRAEKRWLICITIAAAVLRFWNLTQAALWMDEIIILQEAYTGKFKTVSYAAHSAHLGPQGWFLHIFGQNELGVRFWPALLGTLAIPAIFAWMLWTAGKVAGRITAILACVNCFLIYYAQDGNYYGGMTFYTAIMLCGFAIFFRGAPYAGILMTVIAGFLNYKNHPIAIVPFVVTLGMMGLASLTSSKLRNEIYSKRMDNWKGRPAIPLLCMAVVVGGFFVAGAWASVTKSFFLLAEPGEGTLKNVEFGWRLFGEHLADFLVNFYRPVEDIMMENKVERMTGGALGIVAGCGIWLAVALGIIEKKPRQLCLALLVVGAIGASYYVLFSIQLKRNFYVRYFTYLVPMLLAMIAYALCIFQEKVAALTGLRRVGYYCCACLAIGNMSFTGRYLIADKRNEKTAIPILREKYQPGDKFILMTAQDRIAANYYFEKAGLPTESPTYTILQPPDNPMTFAGPLKYVINGIQNTYFVSEWRFTRMKLVWRFFQKYAEHVSGGVSKLGYENDVSICYIRGDEIIVYPGLAAIFKEGMSGRFIIPDTFYGWKVYGRSPLNPGGELIKEIDSQDSLSAAGVTNMEAQKWIPQLRAGVPYYEFDCANWPENQTLSGTFGDIRNERDGSYDFLMYQPEGPSRFLQVNLQTRDESDPVLSKNEADKNPIPPGMLLGIAVDGIHRGFWKVPSEKTPSDFAVAPRISLTPGNHRVTISGLQPREQYTPYFPWVFNSAMWLRSFAGSTERSLEEKGDLVISPGWPSLLQTGNPGEAPSREWTISEGYETIVDPNLKCVAGDSPIRISFPPKSQETYTLLTPVMPVTPGTLAVYTMYLKLEGLDDNEVTPIHLFISKDGEQIPNILHANGSNLRGTTLGVKGWVRRQITVPVPENAKFMMGGVRVYPVPNGNTTGGKLWIGSVFSPGAGDLKLKDPILPDNYFGVSESTPLPADDAATQ
ncbi:MAG: hypothetical protein ABI579_01440 [Candidatus Sumerlaeota bacterium]